MQSSHMALLGMVIVFGADVDLAAWPAPPERSREPAVQSGWANEDRGAGFEDRRRTPVDPRLAPGDYLFTIEHDGWTREYELHVPPGYSGAPVPLVVDFHGWGVGSTAQSNFSGFRAKSDQEGFLVAWPQGLGDAPSWNGGECCGFAVQNDIDDVGFAEAVVADVAARTAIDLGRVYATGQSNGGGLTQRLGCEAADVFAGIAPVAYPLTDSLLANCQPARPIPVVHFHGIYDVNVPYEGRGFFLGAVESHDAWAVIHGCTDPEPERILTEGNSYCDAYVSCAGGIINVLCTVNASHGTYPNPDIDVPAVAWDLLSPYSLPSPTATAVGAVSGLKLAKQGEDLGLIWGPDCGVGDTYNIYRGDLSLGYDSLQIEACGVDAVHTAVPTGAADGEFFLVVPNGIGEEGSYGEASSGARISALTACAPQVNIDSCASGR